MSDKRKAGAAEAPSQIALLTSELADLIHLTAAIEHKHAASCDDDQPPAVLPDGRHLATYFEHIDREIFDAIEGIKAEIARREPVTLADVASLFLMFCDSVDEYIDEYGNDADDYDRKALRRSLQRSKNAIVRGLRATCSDHPLLEVDYFVTRDSRAFSEELARARDALAGMPDAASTEGGAHA